MTLYIIIYSLVLLVTLADFRNYPKTSKQFLLICLIIILVLFRGLRWRTGTDWTQFEMCFETCSWDNITDYDRYGDGRERMEMGYVFLNWLVKQFGNYTLFLILTNTFLVGTWAFMSKKFLPDYFLTCFAMILASNMFFPVRLQLAAGMFCWVLYELIQRKWVLVVLFYIATCLIHKSALVLLLILPFLLIRIGDNMSYVFLGISLIGEVISQSFSDYMVLGAIVLSKYYPDLAVNIAMYSDAEISGHQETSLFHVVMSFLFSFFLLFFMLKARKIVENKNCDIRNKEWKIRSFNVFMNCFLLFTFIYKFFSADSLSNLTRLSEFFTCGYAISLILTYELIITPKRHRIIYLFFIAFYVYKVRHLLNNPYPEVFYPYFSVFDDSLRNSL